MTRGEIFVVGGGPAGALAARELSRSGQRVTLLEARARTNDKVCGACLHPSAVHELERAGLAGILERERAPELHTLELFRGARRARLRVPLGRVLSRRALDESLLQAALDAGVELRRGHTVMHCASSAAGVELELRDAAGVTRTQSAQVVLLAHGLGNVRGTGEAGSVRRTSEVGNVRGTGKVAARTLAPRLGAGIVLPAGTPGPARGALQMFVAPEGYLGVVRLEDDRLDLAAAFDAAALRDAGGAGALAARILERAQQPLHELARAATWRGTPALARPHSPSRPNLLRLGDAAGSVEPFTGEGLRRAFSQARAVVEPAIAAASGDAEAAARWDRARRDLLRADTTRVNRLARALRHPRVVALGIELAALWPAAGERIARGLHGTAAAR